MLPFWPCQQWRLWAYVAQDSLWRQSTSADAFLQSLDHSLQPTSHACASCGRSNPIGSANQQTGVVIRAHTFWPKPCCAPSLRLQASLESGWLPPSSEEDGSPISPYTSAEAFLWSLGHSLQPTSHACASCGRSNPIGSANQWTGVIMRAHTFLPEPCCAPSVRLQASLESGWLPPSSERDGSPISPYTRCISPSEICSHLLNGYYLWSFAIGRWLLPSFIQGVVHA